MKLLLKAWMIKWMGLPTCEEIEQFAYAYMEGGLAAEQKRKFEQHLKGCDNCYRFIQTYREVAQPERLLHKIPLDPSFERKVIEFLKENR